MAAIARGADINVRRRFSIPVDRERVEAQHTPLMAAIAAHDAALALRLLAVSGIALETDDLVQGRTALIAAARAGDPTLVAALVAAAWGGHDDLLDELLARGADLGRGGGAALARAANAGNTSTVQFLVARGVSVDGRDANGWTPLMAAARQGHEAAAACLLALGADKTIADDTGKTALDWARAGNHDGIVALLERAAPQR
jgi:uncharacterized protein